MLGSLENGRKQNGIKEEMKSWGRESDSYFEGNYLQNKRFGKNRENRLD